MSNLKSWAIEVKQDPNSEEDLVIEFPEDLLNSVGWKEGDIIVWTMENDRVILSKKTEKE